jgi:hypothetical protein
LRDNVELRIGIMQPYFLPYIGYFSLINAVEKFVLADDLQYIRRGWVNRNRIKVQGCSQYISVPVKAAPRATPINKIELFSSERSIYVLRRKIEANYSRCPYFNEVKNLILNFLVPTTNLSDLNIALIKRVCDYLKISTSIYISSELNYAASVTREKRIQSICKTLGCTHYINSIGGIELYSKEDFSKLGLTLSFLKMNSIDYPQGQTNFVPDLSIIDVLMWNSRADVRKMLNNYSLL